MSSARVRQLVRELKKLRAARREIIVIVRSPGDPVPATPAATPTAFATPTKIIKVWTKCSRCIDGHIDPDSGGCSRCGGGRPAKVDIG